MTRILLTSALAIVTGSNVLAQDGWSHTERRPPPKEFWVAEDTAGFATGSFQVIIAKGGPTGLFAWTHLHARHNDRTGSTSYKVAGLVKDDANYSYWISPVGAATVSGRFDAPDNNEHQYGQWALPDDVVKAWQKGTKLSVHAAGDRNRKSIVDHATKSFGDYLDGKLKSGEFLKLLNKNKK